MTPEEMAVPLTWVIGVALTFVGLWIPVVFALLSQARNFGGMQAKLDNALAEVVAIRELESRVQHTETSLAGTLGEVATIRLLESRVQHVETWIERLRENIHGLRNKMMARGDVDSTELSEVATPQARKPS